MIIMPEDIGGFGDGVAGRARGAEMSKSYYAVQDADLLAEAEMERGLFIAASTFLETDVAEEDIYSTVIRALSLAQNFLYKYEDASSDILKRTAEIIQDASNGMNLNELRNEYEEIRQKILKRALTLGFGRQSEPKYPWEYKMVRQSQIPLTPGLDAILSKKKATSASSSKQ